MKRPRLSGRHLDVRVSLDHLEGRGSAAEQRRIEDHLAGPCDRCRRMLLEVSRLIESMRTDRAEPVPNAVRARALAVYSRPKDSSKAGIGAWQLATLIFDSLRDPVPAIARRSVGEARWLRFSLGGPGLELEVEPDVAGASTIRGRLIVFDAPLYRVEVQVGAEQLHAWPDAEGRFALEHVPAGEAEVTVSGPQERFRLPRIVL